MDGGGGSGGAWVPSKAARAADSSPEQAPAGGGGAHSGRAVRAVRATPSKAAATAAAAPAAAPHSERRRRQESGTHNVVGLSPPVSKALGTGDLATPGTAGTSRASVGPIVGAPGGECHFIVHLFVTAIADGALESSSLPQKTSDALQQVTACRFSPGTRRHLKEKCALRLHSIWLICCTCTASGFCLESLGSVTTFCLLPDQSHAKTYPAYFFVFCASKRRHIV